MENEKYKEKVERLEEVLYSGNIFIIFKACSEEMSVYLSLLNWYMYIRYTCICLLVIRMITYFYAQNIQGSGWLNELGSWIT